MNIMKTFIPFVACALALATGPVWGQPVTTTRPAPFNPVPVTSLSLAGSAANTEEPTKFNLDFPGGTPKELIAAIQKAMGRPLNAIVPEEFAEQRLPALKMENVNVPQLFDALAASGRKNEAVTSSSSFGGVQNYQVVQTGYGFRQGSQVRVTDNTIWYFYVDKPVLPPVSSQSKKMCRFYSLAGYVDQQHLSVDDITTAIETAWKMLGESQTPTISYHKDTKLLIAVGEPNKLETIDSVLRALSEAPKPRPALVPIPTPTTSPVPEKPKKGE